MKRAIYLFLLFFLLLPRAASAYDFVSGGIYYNITSTTEKTCEVTSYNSKYSGDITIPESVDYNGTTYSVTTIGDYAFYYCSGLTSVDIPNSVTSIGKSAFDYCSNLTSVDIPNSVTTIGDYAFRECTSLTSVDIPNSVTSIGSAAFYGCSGLTSVDIPSSVTSIGSSAFRGCSGFTSVDIPSSVTSIGSSAFYGCSSLTELNISDGSETLTFGSGVFKDCPLSSVYLGRNFECSSSSLSYAPFYGKTSMHSLVVGSSVTSIGTYAFSGCSGLTAVDIPNSVTTIGSSAFSGCTGLTSVDIPNSVTSIESYAFSGCTGLTSVDIPSSVTSIGSGVFSGCSGLTSIDIPNSVTSIGERAFRDCTGLTSVDIPNSVTSIGSYAFYNCTSLTELNISDGSETLTFGSYVFEDCPLTSVYLGRNFECSSSYSPYAPFYEKTSIQSLVVGSSVTSIGNSAFSGCTQLYSVTIGSGVQSIGSSAFSGISPKKVIWYPNTPPDGYKNVGGLYNYVSNTSYSGLDNMEVYPYLSSLFEMDGIRYVPVSPSERTCDAIDCAYDSTAADIRIENTVSYQGIALTVLNVRPYVCYGNNFINTVKISGYDGEIPIYAFSSCSKLQGISLPDSVKSIGEYCFSGCSSLAYVNIGAGISVLPEFCFHDCSSLPSIVIPATVDSLSDYVFEGCNALAYVTIADRETELVLGSNGKEPLFADCPLDTVYIGGNISYSTGSSYGYSPFYRNTSLETVRITDQETEITENEFYGCTNLKNVVIGDGIQHIGNYAFSGCSSLDNFTFGTSLESIGEEAFSDCTAMTRLVSNTVTPPECGTQALDDINKWTCELYVPDVSLELYKAADQWKKFFFINGIATGIESPVADAAGSDLERVLAGPFEVFNLSGQRVARSAGASSLGEALSGLARGVYVLTGNGATYKALKQ